MTLDRDGDTEGGRRPLQIIGLVLIVVLVAALSWFVVRRVIVNDDDETVAPADATVTPSSAETTGDETTGDGATVAPATIPASTEAAGAGAGGGGVPSTDDTTTTAAPTTTADSTTTTVVETTEPATSPPSTGAPSMAQTGTYDTLPDGSPLPVVATFDGSLVTLSGAVPDQASADLLQELARANSRDPVNATVVNNLTINPNVPINVGVRVLELQSERFPEGSSEVLPPHAADLDRVVRVMQALPNISAIVVGHSDQRGDDAFNRTLSEERARSVVNYLAGAGIDPSRLSSRGVGEADLLSINDDEAALALNRRTEFIFSGLLVR